MTEEVIRFGDNGRLCGILTLPVEMVSEPVPAVKHAVRTPTVIFLSAGLLPKSGPYRMYTELARAFAAHGFPTFRVDLSGNGDSLGAIDTKRAEQTILADTRAAIDELQERLKVDKVILFGLCSGAEAAHRAALVDARVTGVIALDGFIARNTAYYFWRYLPRVFSLAKWQQFLANRFRAVFRKRNDDSPRDDSVEFWDEQYPSRDELAAGYRELCSRGVRQLMVYSGGSTNCSYTRQFHDVFRDVPERDCVDAWYLPYADHTYMLKKDRDLLKRIVCRWLDARFLPGQATPDCRRLGLPYYAVDVRETG